MRFWIVQASDGSNLGAATTFREAKAIADASPLSVVDWVDVPVNAESIRRLLTGGGYAAAQSEDSVYASPAAG